MDTNDGQGPQGTDAPVNDAKTGSNGGGAPAGDPVASWYDGFADPLKEYAKTKGFKGADAALEAYQNLERKFGERAFPEPDLEKLEDWTGWDKLRGGKDPSTYELKTPELPEGLEFDRGMLDHVLAKSGKFLPEKVAQSLTNDVGEYFAKVFEGQVEAQNQKVAALNAALDKDWGEHRAAKTARAQQVYKTLFQGDADALASVERLAGEHATLRLMDRLGDLLGEDKIHRDLDGPAGGAEQAQAEIDKLRVDKEFMKSYNDKAHPENKAAIARLTALYARLPQEDEEEY